MTNKTAQPLGTQRYGWVIVGVLLLIQTVSSGLGFYNMSVYINRLSAELAVPVSDISFAVSLFFVVGGVAGGVADGPTDAQLEASELADLDESLNLRASLLSICDLKKWPQNFHFAERMTVCTSNLAFLYIGS